MGTIAARKFRQVTENAENVVAMEILSASQALDMLKPLEPAGAIKAALQAVREKVPFAAEDRVFSDDIDQIREMIRSEKLAKVILNSVGELEW
jgi:histidine ammonia-lyase